MSEGGGLLGELTAIIGLDLTELKAKAVEAKTQFAELDAEAETHAEKASALASGALGAGVVIGAVGLGIAAESVKIAENDEQAQAKLQTAMKNTGNSFDAYKAQIDDQAKAFENLGVNHAEYFDALAKMTEFVPNTTDAMKDLNVAQDVAAGTGKSLSDSTQIVGLAADGNVNKLKALGINLDLTTGNAKALANAQGGLDKANQTLAQTTASVQSGQLKGPAAAAALGKAQQGVKDAQDKLTAAHSAGSGALQALSDLYGGQAATKADTFAGKQDVLKAKTEDISGALGEKLIPMLIKLIDWFNKEEPKFELGCKIIGDKWDELSARFERGVAKIEAVYDRFRNGAQRLHDDVFGTIHTIEDDWNRFTSDLDKGGEEISGGFTRGVDDIKNAFSEGFNWIIDKYNSFASAMSVHTGIPGVPDINVPQIQHVKFHQGGMVPGAPGTEQLALLMAGERVVPASMAADSGGHSMQTTINIAGNADKSTVELIRKELDENNRRFLQIARTGSGGRRTR